MPPLDLHFERVVESFTRQEYNLNVGQQPYRDAEEAKELGKKDGRELVQDNISYLKA